MAKVYVAEIETFAWSTTKGEGHRLILKVLNPRDAEEVKRIYEQYGKKAAKNKIAELPEIKHYIRTKKAYRSHTFGDEALWLIIAREPFVVVVDWYKDIDGQISYGLDFIEAKEKEIPDDELTLLEQA